MIILPVEKRLKWNRAPYILFSIVFINIAIFFFYQMNDSEKLLQATEMFHQQALHKIEVPIYMEYLEQPENLESKKTLDRFYEQNFSDEHSLEEEEQVKEFMDLTYDTMGMDYDPEEMEKQIREIRYKQIVIPLILQDSGFYDYLKAKPDLFESTEVYNSWKESREEINDVINSASSAKYALIPAEKNWFTYISHQFMHGDLMHLAGNMFFLIMCGFAVEAAIGHVRFLLFYLICGAVGGFAHAMSEPNSIIPLVGASGAISGVMAMYMGVFRLQKIEFFYWFYIIVGYFRAPALLILAIYIGKEAVSYFYLDDGVAYMAHMGGFVAGFLLILAVLVFKRDFLDDEYIEADDNLDAEQIHQAEIKSALEKLHFNKALELLNSEVATDPSTNKFYSENILLNAKLLQLTDKENSDTSIVKLLASQKPKLYELKEYVAIWDKVQNKSQTPPDARLKLGLSFLEMDDISISENIFMTLVKQKYHDNRMSMLAGRLAYHYDQKQQSEKAEYYLNLSQAYE